MIQIRQLIEILKTYDEEKEIAVQVDGCRVVFINKIEPQMIRTCPACFDNVLMLITSDKNEYK